MARLLLQAPLRPEEEQESLLRQSEGVSGPGGQLLVEPAAPEGQIAKERGRLLGASAAGSAPEADPPRDEPRIQAGPDIERALGIAHPSEGLPHDAGRGQGNEVAG